MKSIIVKNFKLSALIATLLVVLACATVWVSCRDDMHGKIFLITDDVMIDDYITQKDPTMSAFLEIVDKADLRGMIHAYGTYTCFIPTNEGVAAYLSSKGKSSIADLDVDECVNLVKYHVIPDVITTAQFIDGRLTMPNMSKKYLTTITESVGARTEIFVNRDSRILEPDILTGNGYIHKIDKVLSVAERTVGEEIMMLSDDYSFFKLIMQQTGWIDSLNNRQEDVWFTVFLQHDNSFVGENITNPQALAAKVKERMAGRLEIYLAMLRARFPELAEKDDDFLMVWTFCAYHVLGGLYYVADLNVASALLPFAPNQAITFNMVRRDGEMHLIVNKFDDDETPEPGVFVNLKSKNTDLSCYNGVMVELGVYISPVIRPARPVFFDLTQQPEIMKDSRYKRQSFDLTRDQIVNLSEIEVDYAQTGVSAISYSYNGGYDARNAHANGHSLEINIYRFNWISFMLPLLAEGEYNVWICLRRGSTEAQRISATFLQEGQEDQELGRLVATESYYNSSDQDAELIMQNHGQKRYTPKHRENTMLCHWLGTITVQTTGRHWLRINVANRGRNTQAWYSMMQIIPTDKNQFWPRIDFVGNVIQSPETPCHEIFPYDLGGCPENQNY